MPLTFEALFVPVPLNVSDPPVPIVSGAVFVPVRIPENATLPAVPPVVPHTHALPFQFKCCPPASGQDGTTKYAAVFAAVMTGTPLVAGLDGYDTPFTEVTVSAPKVPDTFPPALLVLDRSD
jgi:hypothetical protein